jgi:hypothetical protein
MSEQVKYYVVYYCERMRDGREEGAKVGSLEYCLEIAQKMRNGFCGDNTEVRIFELGKEIPLEEEQIMEQPKPAVEKIVIKVKK